MREVKHARIHDNDSEGAVGGSNKRSNKETKEETRYTVWLGGLVPPYAEPQVDATSCTHDGARGGGEAC